MKKSKISPLPTGGNDKITIGDELTGPEREEYYCDSCRYNLVKISDRQGNNEEWFCRNCSIAYPDVKEIRHRHRLTVPEETETAVSIVNVDYTKDVEIRHSPELRGGIAELQKRGLKITYFDDSSQR